MAIDFSKVKKITIPEGSVTKITDSTGNTLWQGVGWHTIWEGNKTCSIKFNGDNVKPTITGNENNFAQTVSGTGYTPKIRITFSYSITSHVNSLEDSFYLNDSWTSNFPASPIIIDQVEDTSTNRLCGPCVAPSSFSAYARVLLVSKQDTENNILNFYLEANNYNLQYGYSPNFTITLTVTKIEQYY